MAMVARSICVGNNARVRPGPGMDERFHRQRAVQLRLLVKFWPTSRNPRYFQLNINYSKKFHGLGSKGSRLKCSRTEDNASSFAMSTNKVEVRRMVKYLVEKVSYALKERRHLHLIKVVGLLACTLMFVPSANAVDALKTCACLLKGCR